MLTNVYSILVRYYGL